MGNQPDETNGGIGLPIRVRRDAGIGAILKSEGWKVNHKRAARLTRQEGLTVPFRQPKSKHLWLNDGPCERLRPEPENHL